MSKSKYLRVNELSEGIMLDDNGVDENANYYAISYTTIVVLWTIWFLLVM